MYYIEDQDLDLVIADLKQNLSDFRGRAENRIMSNDWNTTHKLELKSLIDKMFQLQIDLNDLQLKSKTMSIKTTVVEGEQTEQSFPCVMINEDKDVVIFVLKEKNEEYQGVALVHPYIPYWDKKVTGWIKDYFKPLVGSITVENI